MPAALDVTPAVVLRTRRFREADLIVILLTAGRGKVDCIARGARKSRKRFPGGLPVGARGEASLSRHGRGSLVPLSSFFPTADHGVLGRDLEVFAYVAYLCELTDVLVGTGAADATTFGGLIEVIEATMAHSEPVLLRRHELGLLRGLGLLPALEQCGVCASPPHRLPLGVAFSAARGGVLCGLHGKAAGYIPEGVIALALAALEGLPEARAAAVLASPDARRGLRDLCRELIAPHLRQPLRSLAFFAQIRK